MVSGTKERACRREVSNCSGEANENAKVVPDASMAVYEMMLEVRMVRVSMDLSRAVASGGCTNRECV